MQITQLDLPPWKKTLKINSNSFVLCFKTYKLPQLEVIENALQ